MVLERTRDLPRWVHLVAGAAVLLVVAMVLRFCVPPPVPAPRLITPTPLPPPRAMRAPWELPPSWPGQVIPPATYVPPVSVAPEPIVPFDAPYPRTYALMIANTSAMISPANIEMAGRFDIAEISYEGGIAPIRAGEQSVAAEIKAASMSGVKVMGYIYHLVNSYGWKWIGDEFGGWDWVPNVAPTPAPNPYVGNPDDYFFFRRALDWRANQKSISAPVSDGWNLNDLSSAPNLFDKYRINSGKMTLNPYNGPSAYRVDGDTMAEWACQFLWTNLGDLDGLREDVIPSHVWPYIRRSNTNESWQWYDHNNNGIRDRNEFGGSLRDAELMRLYGALDIYNCLRHNGITVWGNASWEPDVWSATGVWDYIQIETMDGFMVENEMSTTFPQDPPRGWMNQWEADSRSCFEGCQMRLAYDWAEANSASLFLINTEHFQPAWGWSNREAMNKFWLATTLQSPGHLAFQEGYNVPAWYDSYWVAYDAESGNCGPTLDAVGSNWLGQPLSESQEDGDGQTMAALIAEPGGWRTIGWRDGGGTGKAWGRRFDYGFAAANMSSGSKTIALPAGRRYEDFTGAAYVDSITLAAKQGLVLCDIDAMAGGVPPEDTPTPVPPQDSYTLPVIADAYMNEWSPTTNYGAALYNQIRTTGPQQPLFKVDVSVLPEAGSITSATFHFYQARTPGSDQDVSAYRLLKTWDEAEVTSVQALVGVDWELSNATGPSDRDATAYGVVNMLGTGWYQLDVTDLVRYWRDNPGSNLGWKLETVASDASIYHTISSRENAEKWWPYVEVAFVPPTSTPVPVPTDTPVSIPTPTPPFTSTPVPIPTDTPIPPPTSTPVTPATNTPELTDTPVIPPTDTPIPPPTSTPVPPPTDTPIPPPTDTPIPPPTSTPVPPPTDTPVPPPTDTPVPPPTDTPVPPPTSTPVTPATNTPVLTDTPVIPPTDTPVPPPTDTPVPPPTDTPIPPPTSTPVTPATNTPIPPPTSTPVPPPVATATTVVASCAGASVNINPAVTGDEVIYTLVSEPSHSPWKLNFIKDDGGGYCVSLMNCETLATGSTIVWETNVLYWNYDTFYACKDGSVWDPIPAFPATCSNECGIVVEVQTPTPVPPPTDTPVPPPTDTPIPPPTPTHTVTPGACTLTELPYCLDHPLATPTPAMDPPATAAPPLSNCVPVGQERPPVCTPTPEPGPDTPTPVPPGAEGTRAMEDVSRETLTWWEWFVVWLEEMFSE